MIKLSLTNAVELVKTGVETNHHPSNWNGAYGLAVDKSYELPNKFILDLTCLNGWLYEARL